MRNKKNILIVIILICLMQFLVIAPNVYVAAATDLADDLEFITNVTLTDYAGNPLGDNIAKDGNVKLTYYYAIPNQSDIHVGDTFTFTIPNQILISAPGSFNLIDSNSGEVIGTGAFSMDGTVVITFTNYQQSYSNITGSFWWELKFNENNIGNTNPESIEFNIGSSSDPVVIDVNFDQPEPEPTSIEKTGQFDVDTNEITWTVTINPEKVTVNNAKMVDDIQEGQEYISGSVKINGEDANPTYYTYENKTLTYTFPEQINTQQIIKFKTKVKDSEIFYENSHGTTIQEKNTAILNHDGISITSNEASVNVPINFISKTGSFNNETKQIDWVITINKNAVSIKDAVLTDTLPSGLTLDEDSVRKDGSLTDAFSYESNIFTYNFGDNISEKHTITFSTNVESDAFKSNTRKTYTNIATLTGVNVPDNAQSTRGVGVPTNVVRKQGINYDKTTGEITWRITVNSNEIDIINPVITDNIRIGQTYVDNSAKIVSGPAGGSFNYVVANPGDSVKTGILTYSFTDISDDSTTISDKYIIEFKTKVVDPKVYAGNADKYYYNTATLIGDNIPSSSNSGNEHVKSEVIKKTGTGYNYVSREIQWTIVVNSNMMELLDVVLEDNIRVGQEFVEGSASIDNGASQDGFSYMAYENDLEKTGVLTYTFPSVINDTYTITFNTRITDLNLFITNGNKVIENTALLSHELVPEGIESTGKQTIKNTVIGKVGDYTLGNTYIDWGITINSNVISLDNSVITDQFQEGLALDTTSIRLFHQTQNTDGSLTLGEEIELTADNVKYDIDTRTLNFNIPSPVEGAYLLTFTTDVTDKSKSPFTNQAYFNGTGSLESGTTDQIAVAWAGSGSTGIGEVGSITVIKVDSEDNEKTLEGSVFELLDRYGNAIQRSSATGADGAALFERLRFDIDYTVREVTSPTGYNISNEDYTFQIKGTDDEKNITYMFEDEIIKGNVLIYKHRNSNPLAGAEFTLYDEEDKVITTSLTDENGEVLFSDVPYGNYLIRETQSPEGYIASEEVIEVSIINGTTSRYEVENEIIKGSIEIHKTDMEGNDLQNAIFTLYNEENEAITTGTSDENGIIIFEDVEYGNYTLKETKAPEGYSLNNEKIEVKIVSSETLSYHVKNDIVSITNSPKTGDKIDNTFKMLAFAILMIIGIQFLDKKIKKRIKNN